MYIYIHNLYIYIYISDAHLISYFQNICESPVYFIHTERKLILKRLVFNPLSDEDKSNHQYFRCRFFRVLAFDSVYRNCGNIM